MFILVHTELTKPLIYMLLLSILIEIQNVNYTTPQLSWSIPEISGWTNED